MNLLPLLAIVLVASIGQLLLKMSVLGRTGTLGVREYFGLLLNPYFVIGMAMYAATSVAWIWALKNYPLSKVYPVLALTFVLVPVLARLFLNEKLAMLDLVGMALILAGVSLIGTRV